MVEIWDYFPYEGLFMQAEDEQKSTYQKFSLILNFVILYRCVLDSKKRTVIVFSTAAWLAEGHINGLAVYGQPIS